MDNKEKKVSKVALEYIACANAESIETIKQNMLESYRENPVPLNDHQFSQLSKLFDRMLSVAMEHVAIFLSENFTDDEILRLIEMRKDPLSKRLEDIAPRSILLLGSFLQGIVSELDDIMSNPGRIDEVLPS
jgi:hypothetical protein